MGYSIASPSPVLSRFVKHYWTLDSCISCDHEHTQRIVPNGLLELIFYLGDRPQSTDPSRSVTENTILTGHLSNFYDLRVAGHLSLFSILFKPQGLSMFFDIPIDELNNRNVPLKYIFKSGTGELESQLSEEKTFTGRVKIVEQFLLQLLRKSGDKYNYERIEHTISIINRSSGAVSIDFLASEACFGRKQFERVFSKYVGTSPKQFLRTIRLQHAIHLRSKDAAVNLTDLTYRSGYYDQSHMINDFQKLTGLTPKQFFDASEPFSDYFSSTPNI